MITAEEVKALLRLTPHPAEGGYFTETYRSEERVAEGALPARYAGARAFGTAIYYLLTPDTVSAMHRLASDEVFHFYLGDPVEMLHLFPDGSGRVVTLGPAPMDAPPGGGAARSVAGLAPRSRRALRAAGLHRRPRLRL